MPRNLTMGVRLDPGQREALEKLASSTGIDASQLVRFAIKAILDYADANNGRILLPLNFSETFMVKAKEEPAALKPRRESAA